MRRRRHGIAVIGMAIAISAAMLGLSTVPASAANPSMLTKSQVRKALLTLKEIKTVSGVPVTADSVECHHNPYLAGTYVNYCYYTVLGSDAAFTAGRLWPNHVDIISFESSKVARAYIKDMLTTRTTSVVLRSSPYTAIFYDKDGFITTPADSSGQVGNSKAPTVSVFSYRGSNAVYTACTDPKATGPAALAKCATDLAKAQLKKLG
jgi:hypothetical protein